MSKIATLQSTSAAAAAAAAIPAFVPLGYGEERIVLGLMMQGKTNLAILNHHSTVGVRLTLEQIQRVRELAGLMPSTPSRDTMPSHPGRRPAPKGIVEPSGRSTANTAEEKYGSSLSSPSTVSLRGPAIELPPEFMREKSEVATGAARAASSMLMRSFKGRGWQGTLAALGIYLVAIYLFFLAVAHLVAALLHWMLEHRVMALIIIGGGVWVWSQFIGYGPWRVGLSRAATGVARGYAMQASLAALMAVRQVVAWAAGNVQGGENEGMFAGESDGQTGKGQAKEGKKPACKGKEVDDGKSWSELEFPPLPPEVSTARGVTRGSLGRGVEDSAGKKVAAI